MYLVVTCEMIAGIFMIERSPKGAALVVLISEIRPALLEVIKN